MILTNDLNETLQICNLDQTNADIVSNVQKTDMTFIWNKGPSMKIEVDRNVYHLQQNQIIFLTEFHKIDSPEFESVRMVRFNQPFYCTVSHDNEVESKGMLFFGASDVPIITVDENLIRDFELSWEIFCTEMNKNDILKQDMLQSLLKEC